MQIKTKMRYYLIPIRMAFVKRQQMTSVGEDMEKRKLLGTVCGNVIGLRKEVILLVYSSTIIP